MVDLVEAGLDRWDGGPQEAGGWSRWRQGWVQSCDRWDGGATRGWSHRPVEARMGPGHDEQEGTTAVHGRWSHRPMEGGLGGSGWRDDGSNQREVESQR